jgi:threonine synthase
VTEKTPVISLHQGGTPLIRARNLEGHIGGGFEIWLKYEGLNPTASFKDRGMTMAVSKAVERGAKAIICASTGNTSSSAAAYAARARIKCLVVLPEGAIAKGKLAQARMYGAQIIAIKGNFDDALNIVRDIGARPTSKSSTPSIPTGSKDRRPRRLKSATRLAAHPTTTCYR